MVPTMFKTRGIHSFIQVNGLFHLVFQEGDEGGQEHDQM